MMSPTAVFVTTDLFSPFLAWSGCTGALVQTGCTGFDLFPSVNLTRLLHSSMRTIMRSTVLIFYENTTLLCCISLTLASLNSELPNSIFLCWIFMSLSRSLSLGKISLTLFFPVVGICRPARSLVRGKKENTAKVSIVFPNCTLSVLRGMWEG